MKKGINIWSFAADTTLKQACELAKKAGFEGIEYSISEDGELSVDKSNDEVKAIAAMTKDMGLEITSLASGLCWKYPCTSSDKNIVNRGNDIIKRQIEMASILGVENILVIPGYVAADHVPDSEVIPYDVAYERAFEQISKLAVIAEQEGVTIALENCWTKFLLSPFEFRDFVDKFNSKRVKAYFDIANVLATGYPEHWIPILGERIKRVHFKDYRRSPGGLNCFCNLLAGDVNFPAVVEQLNKINYTSYVIAEIIPNYKYYTDRTIYDASAAMDAILKRD